ncbi:MAG: response regulator receiver modulated diguanylate phosphodiesterase [Acidobacteria bacterium]|nr:response regulator receiver modulated diguanylate phosphodiesterase [Acidobacteriota bacterium]
MSKIEKPTVLLVDDNEATCVLVRALLQREFSVEVAMDGSEALEKLKTTQYAAILLDLRMPVLDGFGVLEHLREHSPDTLPRVLVLTAALTRAELARAREFRICGIIEKPFEVEDLLAAVRQCVGPSDGGSIGSMFCSTTPVFLLIADLIRQLR